MVSKYVDILTVAETKIDETFTTSQFMIEGFGEYLTMLNLTQKLSVTTRGSGKL